MMLLDLDSGDLPLKESAHIVHGNALRLNWNNVVPAEECDYIMGNPPFIGYSNHNKEQEADRAALFGKVKTVDYVACWYWKASEYIDAEAVRAAFVSTNSICQGQQVAPIWKPLFDKGFHIDFAWTTFVWGNEATEQAQVHVVIVGFSKQKVKKKLFVNNDVKYPENINAYLAPSPNVFVEKHLKPLSDVPEVAQGFKPADNGYLLMYREERDAIVSAEPDSEKWIRPFSMGADFIKGDERFCFWLPDITQNELDRLPLMKQRVEQCRNWRSLQTQTGDAYKLKNTPHLLRPCNKFHDKVYIGIPKVSSERRYYIPMGFVTNGMIPGDKLYFVETSSLYHFGVMLSQFHNAWMRTVAGRLKSDYSYSNTIVYNNFIWPESTSDQCEEIERCAREVLESRARHPDDSLAKLYDPGKMPEDLLLAHHNLDAAVEKAYGVDFQGDEEKIVAHLFKLYEEVIRKEQKEKPLKGKQADSNKNAKSSKTTVRVKVKVKPSKTSNTNNA